MREVLSNLLKKAIISEYSVPHHQKGIPKIDLTTNKSPCLRHSNKDDLIELIYNSIVDYSFNEFDMTGKDYDLLLMQALKTKIKYNEYAAAGTKLKYGFFGEVLLYAILHLVYQAKPLVSRGFFYNPLENSETKGYDSYHLIEKDSQEVELWFGEVKFHADFTSGLNSAMAGVEKALSDSYLEKNILALNNYKNNLVVKGSKIEEILNSWEDNPSISIVSEMEKYNMALFYPILLIYSEGELDYDDKINKAVKKINDEYKKKTYGLSIEYKLFFILLPISEVKEIKEEVIKWIESKKPLL